MFKRTVYAVNTAGKTGEPLNMIGGRINERKTDIEMLPNVGTEID